MMNQLHQSARIHQQRRADIQAGTERALDLARTERENYSLSRWKPQWIRREQRTAPFMMS